jgi:anti-sigma B factor antagonist
MQHLTMERSSDGPVEFLAVIGEIDMASASPVISALNKAVGDCDKPVVVDLTGVEFMDSTGLALLLNARRRLARRDMGFAVVCVDGQVHRVFENTELIGTLKVRPDRESAVSAAVGEPG